MLCPALTTIKKSHYDHLFSYDAAQRKIGAKPTFGFFADPSLLFLPVINLSARNAPGHGIYLSPCKALSGIEFLAGLFTLFIKRYISFQRLHSPFNVKQYSSL